MYTKYIYTKLIVNLNLGNTYIDFIVVVYISFRIKYVIKQEVQPFRKIKHTSHCFIQYQNYTLCCIFFYITWEIFLKRRNVN